MNRIPSLSAIPRPITSDNVSGTPRIIQTASAMAFGAMRSHREWCERAKRARACTPDEVAAMREGNRQHDERSVFDAGMAEAKRLGAEAQAMGRPITSDPYDADLWPLHSEAWRNAWQDEAQRRLTETDA